MSGGAERSESRQKRQIEFLANLYGPLTFGTVSRQMRRAAERAETKRFRALTATPKGKLPRRGR